MKKQIQKLILAAILLLQGFSSYATHIVGGELTYVYLGSDNYSITLKMYRDCYNGMPAFDDPAGVGIFSSSNALITTLFLDLDSVATIPGTINNPCMTVPTNICTEVGYYTDVINLPPIAGGYQLAYQRCCRNGITLNVVDPLNVGATFYAQIPDASVATSNNSAIFSNMPPLYLCAGVQFVFDHSATDTDGDELVYSLCDPYAGLDPSSPGGGGTTPDPPPYPHITWQSPYSLSDPMGGTPMIINSNTGQLICTPGAIGTFAVGVCVTEYRNGILIGTVQRDFQFTVSDCNIPVISAFFTPYVQCGNTVSFTNSSTAATDYLWDFGDGNTSTDFEPVHTFPATGEYTITLVVSNTVSSCGDTSILNLTLNSSSILVSAISSNVVCAGSSDGSIDVTVFGGNPPFTYSTDGVNYGSNEDIYGLSAGTYTVYVTDANGCTEAVSVSILEPSPTVVDITLNGSILESNMSTGNEWYMVGDINLLGSAQTYTPTQPGDYYVLYYDGSNCPSYSDTITIITVGVKGISTHSEISVYPNPVNSTITFKGLTEKATATIMDATGRVVLSEEVTNNKVDVAALAAGVYVLRVETGNGVSNYRIVKQ